MPDDLGLPRQFGLILQLGSARSGRHEILIIGGASFADAAMGVLALRRRQW